MLPGFVHRGTRRNVGNVRRRIIAGTCLGTDARIFKKISSLWVLDLVAGRVFVQTYISGRLRLVEIPPDR
jgi:hypothetical protein